jgi:hypothetical protein
MTAIIQCFEKAHECLKQKGRTTQKKHNREEVSEEQNEPKVNGDEHNEPKANDGEHDQHRESEEQIQHDNRSNTIDQTNQSTKPSTPRAQIMRINGQNWDRRTPRSESQ